ncbi:MAG: type II toxin-antitoxin system VapC family toxin [Deltaproteobacteria bacterium]|nr:type II toxin-antitoxin system VapC family toxin [Deltaproteobacteria bacterium]
MIALDTNVVVRFLVADDVAQSRRARALIERGVSEGDRFFIADIVLCEIVWVLDRAYGFARSQIAGTLRSLVVAKNMTLENPERVRAALERYSVGRGDFSDYLIAEAAVAGGCDRVATFDRALHGDPRFVKV